MKMYDAFELYYMTLVFALYSIANYFILPFMRLYTAGVSDINYIDKKLPLLFISISLLSCGRSAANQVINFAGHFKLTQNRAIAEAAINLVTSVVAVQFWGIYGVLIGTIAALLYRSNDIILYANRRILQRSVWMTYKRWVVNLTTFFLILCLNHFLNFNIDSYGKLFLICIPYTILTLIIFFTVSSLFERQIAKYTFRYILSKVIKNEIS